MEYITQDNSINTILTKDNKTVQENKTTPYEKSMFQILTNQKEFIKSAYEKDDIIKHMNKLNIKYTNDYLNLSGSIIKDKNNLVII